MNVRGISIGAAVSFAGLDGAANFGAPPEPVPGLDINHFHPDVIPGANPGLNRCHFLLLRILSCNVQIITDLPHHGDPNQEWRSG